MPRNAATTGLLSLVAAANDERILRTLELEALPVVQPASSDPDIPADKFLGELLTRRNGLLDACGFVEVVAGTIPLTSL
jgi:hypothetical protein